MELTENILWLLKQAFYFSLTTVNDAISTHGVSTAQIGVLRQLSNEPGLSGADLARRFADEGDIPAGDRLEDLVGADRVERGDAVEDEDRDVHGRDRDRSRPVAPVAEKTLSVRFLP